MFTFFKLSRFGLLHVSFWGVYLSFFLYQVSQFRRGHDNYDWLNVILFAGVQMVFIMAISYYNYFITLPRWLKHKNFFRYLLEFSIPFVILVTIRIHLQRLLVDGYTHQHGFFYSSMFTVQQVATMLFIVIFIGMLRFAYDWFDFEAKKKEVQNEKLTAELNFLKAQINPHFLFNTLNNLYYLAFTQSPNTTEVIEKLSQMMRYMIYDSNHARVPLSKEIAYMENYISLERLRLNNQIPINLSVTGNPQELLVVPLIFITFLENAFKHGVSNNNPNAWVNISIAINSSEIIYQIENSKVKNNKNNNTEKSGIGLQNVKRRLELSYPGHYTLITNDLPDQYQVKLKLVL